MPGITQAVAPVNDVQNSGRNGKEHAFKICAPWRARLFGEVHAGAGEAKHQDGVLVRCWLPGAAPDRYISPGGLRRWGSALPTEIQPTSLARVTIAVCRPRVTNESNGNWP
jgi:hypothetical protein